MVALIKVYWEICRLRLGPDVLPRSSALLGVIVAAHLAVGTLLEAAVVALPQALIVSGLTTLALVVMTYTLLTLRGLAARTPQTITALAGCDVLLGLLALPLALTFAPGGEIGALGAMLGLALMGWSLAITAHVLRHALAVSFPVGMGAAILYLLAAMVLVAAFLEPAD